MLVCSLSDFDRGENFVMKSAAEWKTDTLTSTVEHKRRTTALRRLATGIRSEIEGFRTSGLDDKEQKILAQAAALLEKLASIREKAKNDTANRAAAFKSREKKIKAAMSNNFSKLVTIPDMVALVAAVQSYNLREWGAKDLRDLKFYASESLDSLAYMLSGQSGSVEDVVAVAWEKFKAARADLEAKHQSIITTLGN